MPTLIETGALEDCAALCKELGLDFVELNMNLPQYQPDRIDRAHFAEIAEKYGIFYTVHLDENLNISDFNPHISAGYMQTVQETVELAKDLGAPVLNMHLSRGVYFTLPDRRVYLFSEYKEYYLQSILKFRDMCETAVGNSGILLCVENSDGFTDFQKEALEILLASPVFALTFDVGHNHSIGGADGDYILEKRSKLRHMHMHDAVGTKNHLPLGAGELEIEKYLNLGAEHNCRAVLETKTVDGLKSSVNWLKNKNYL